MIINQREEQHSMTTTTTTSSNLMMMMMEPRPLLPVIPEILSTSFRVSPADIGRSMTDVCDVTKYTAWLGDVQITEALIFGNMLEPLSRTPPWLPPIVWLPVAAAIIYHSSASESMQSAFNHPTSTSLATAFIAGVFLWTLIEYVLHRWAFHFISRYKQLPAWALALHFIVHGVHHRYPHDKARLVFPPILTAPITLAVATLLGLPFIPTPWTWCALAGGLVGYVMYDSLHYIFHHMPTFLPMCNSCRRRHMAHHYHKNGQTVNYFGVTSPLWDYVFGTLVSETKNLNIIEKNN
jgi:4-hydroxysphinganine ceramide fatty acyl 2-hydroxylase